MPKLNYFVLIGMFLGVSWLVRFMISSDVSKRVNDRYSEIDKT